MKKWITAIKVTAKVRMSVFVQMISSKPTNILLPNMVSWCIIMRQSVMWKGWSAIFKVKVTSNGQNVSVCPDDIFWTNKHFVTKLGNVMHHHEPECPAKRLACYFLGQGQSKGSYDHDSFYYIFWTADPFVIKRGLIIHYHKPLSLHTCLLLRL